MTITRPAELLRTRSSLNSVASANRRPGCERPGLLTQGVNARPSHEADPAVLPSARENPDVQLNLVGDIVACDGVGELVLLPHLWNFDLLAVGNFLVLRTTGSDLGDDKDGDGSRGMTAVLALNHGLATVEAISETSRRICRPRAVEASQS
jgi:hypothetical protein